MTVVVDASVVVAALVDASPTGLWAEAVLLSGQLAAPHLMPVEVANILRRSILAREISDQEGALAHASLRALRIELFPYELLATRVWELRANLTSYDACYVALAEAFGVPLATLDRRMSVATGPRCRFLIPR